MKGKSTGERFEEFYPVAAEKAIQLLALGMSPQAVATKLKVDKRTIRAFQLSHIEKIEDQRKEALKIVFPGMVMTAERAIEEIPNCTGYQAAGMHGILRETFMHLNNLPTLRAEVTHKIDFVAELQKLKEEAQKKVQEMKQIQGREVPPELPPAA